MTAATRARTLSAVATGLVTSASTELHFPKHREVRVRSNFGARLRHVEAVMIACWRGMLALLSIAVVMISIYANSLYGPHPVTSGLLIGLMVVCLIRFDAAVEVVKRKGLFED